MQTLKKLIINEMLQELNYGVPAKIKYIVKPSDISRYGNLKLHVLITYGGITEKAARGMIWEYVFTINDFYNLSDEDLYNVYQRFTRRRDQQR